VSQPLRLLTPFLLGPPMLSPFLPAPPCCCLQGFLTEAHGSYMTYNPAEANPNQPRNWEYQEDAAAGAAAGEEGAAMSLPGAELPAALVLQGYQRVRLVTAQHMGSALASAQQLGLQRRALQVRHHGAAWGASCLPSARWCGAEVQVPSGCVGWVGGWVWVGGCGVWVGGGARGDGWAHVCPLC
jgi:hypothetical protein